MSVVIFVPLKDGGVDCWRPVHADLVSDDVYEITVEQEPAGEAWAFAPRSLVRCREHIFEDGTQGLLAFQLASSA